MKTTRHILVIMAMLFALLVLLLPVVGSQPNAPPVQEPAGRFILVARVYHDLNRSGTHQPREPMLSGWTFQLYDHNSQPVAYAVSDRFGLVIFTGLKRGIYTLCEQPLPGWLNTQPRQLNPAFGNQPCYHSASPLALMGEMSIQMASWKLVKTGSTTAMSHSPRIC